MKILFLHGWGSTPGGRKPTYLAQQGHQVSNPELCPDDFSKALMTGRQAFGEFEPDLVVGSSRGGAVALNLGAPPETPMVLICPAWKNWGTVKKAGPNTLILHSPDDEVVPFADSLELVKVSDLPETCLWPVGHDHRLADRVSLHTIDKACRALIS